MTSCLKQPVAFWDEVVLQYIIVLLGPDTPVQLLGLGISASVDMLMSACHKPQGGDTSAGHARIDMYTLTVLWSAHCASCSWSAPPACWSPHSQPENFAVCDVRTLKA